MDAFVTVSISEVEMTNPDTRVTINIPRYYQEGDLAGEPIDDDEEWDRCIEVVGNGDLVLWTKEDGIFAVSFEQILEFAKNLNRE